MSRGGDDRPPRELQAMAIYGSSALMALRGFRGAGAPAGALSEITDGIAGRFVAKYDFLAFGLLNSGLRIGWLAARATSLNAHFPVA